MPRLAALCSMAAAVAVACAACGQAATTELLRPGGVKDGGGAARDGGSRDAEPRDLGRRDADAGRDTGGRDRPPVDIDEFPPGDQEGQACTPGSTDQGSCVDPTNQCVTWDPNSFDGLSTCIRTCETADDCRSSIIGRLCGNVAMTIENGRVEPVKACVAAFADEGGRANVSARHAPEPMSGCRDPLQAFPPFIGSQLFALESDQASCGRLCAEDNDCTMGLPRVIAPFCTLGVLSSADTPGVCTTRLAGKGALCSQSSVIEICDVSETPNMICVDLTAANGHANDPRGPYGHCIELCSMMDPSCVTSADPALTATCEFGLFTSPEIGLCDDSCSAFPDTCTALGSPAPVPPQNATRRGMSCMPFGQISGNTDIALCLDVSQNEILFPAWDFMNVPAMPCADDVHRCPDGAVCIPIDLGSSQTSVCVFGCNTLTGTTSCALAPFSSCEAVFGAATVEGVCMDPP